MSVPYGLIYKTENLITADTYIGQTTRMSDTEYFGSGIIISRAIRKYGRENFEREILCYCKSQEDLDHKEKLYISLLKPSYNIGMGGSGAGKHSEGTKLILKYYATGIIPSDETRNKLSLIHKGKKRTLEQCARIKAGRTTSYEVSDATRYKMRISHLGKTASEETRQKMKNRVCTIETRNKLSVANKGKKLSKPRSEDFLLKQKISHLGLKRSEETQAKISLAHYKKVRCIETNIEYDSLQEASLDITGSFAGRSHISDCCLGKRKIAYGYHWEYM